MRTTDTAIYLDYAAATPLDERVFAAMRPFFSNVFFNPSSPYAAGHEVRRAVNAARSTIANILGVKPNELVFTAGATESINSAIYGACDLYDQAHVVMTSIEHAAVLAAARRYQVTVVPVAAHTGLVSPESIAGAVTDKTVVISVGYANGEIGTVQPLREITRRIAEIRSDRLRRGITRPLYVHSDASQAAGLLDVHVDRLGVDLFTLNASKCYGPKQVGLLYIKSGIQLKPFVLGGGQEFGLRSGTENVAGIIGFAEALKLAEQDRKNEAHRLASLRTLLLKKVTDVLPDTLLSGHPSRHLPNIVHMAWPGMDGERLLFALDEAGVMVATGSACAANKGTRSHVLEAIGLEPQVADGSIRLSMGRQTTEAQVTDAARCIVNAVKKERLVAR